MLNLKPGTPNPIVSRVHARPMMGAPALTPPPEPDFLFTGYTGIPGAVEIASVLLVAAAAAWAGIHTALSTKNKTLKVAGWIGGVGSGLLGLSYLGGKSGFMPAGIPAVRVTPS